MVQDPPGRLPLNDVVNKKEGGHWSRRLED
jgi:hypothetical protein